MDLCPGAGSTLLLLPAGEARSVRHRALQRADPSHERDSRTLDRGMPTRAFGPHPDLESEPSAADPAPVRDPPQSAPAAPLAPRRCPAETATTTGHSRAVPRKKTDSRRWHDQRISPGRMTWMRLSAPTGAQHGWKQPGQRRQDGAVGPVRLGPGDLTAEHRDLMTEHHDLGVLRYLAAAEQHQPAEDPDHDQVEQAKGNKPSSCRNWLIRPNRRSQHLRRVLKRYTGNSPSTLSIRQMTGHCSVTWST